MLTDKDVGKLEGTFATKEDLKLLATKEELKNSTKEVKRHFDVVAEDIKSDFKLLSEQVLTFAEKVTEHEEKIKKIETLENNVSVPKTKMGVVEARIK